MAAKIEKKSQSMETTDVTIKKINPIPILGNEFTEDIPTRDAYIGILCEKKNTSIAIKSIANILPGFGHLKRCSDGRLLLAFLGNTEIETSDANQLFDSSEKLKNFLINKNFNLNLLENDIEIIPIPSRAPKTKLQSKKASKIWPVNFHPDPCIESIIDGKFFNDKQLKVIESCMKICIDAANAASSVENSHCNGSAVIIDPNHDESIQLLAVTASKTDEHPLWHAAMLAIDLVAKIQGGGTWQLHQRPVIPDLSTDTRKRKYELQLPLCYPVSLKNNFDFSNFINYHDFSMIKEPSKGNNDDKNVAYLCTNYWIFLLNEPCPLCAMALLHSRVSMIFYNDVNESRGVLGSKALLHTLPGLNHRYRVWSNVLNNTKSNNNFNKN